ncbi:MAG: reverse transcriptase/maturase family protein [Patescibacteria group bacterium]
MIVTSPGSLGGGHHSRIFHDVISVANLLAAWNEFKKGKRKKRDVMLFELHLENNIFQLHHELLAKTYVHGPYTDFYVCDPKRRHIHKASVRDRVLHQALFRVLYPIFDKHFIFDSYSSRVGKGTHFGVTRLARACRKANNNWHMPAYALKCDVRKFFDSVDHDVLRKLLRQKIVDLETLWLIDVLLNSFTKTQGKGLPLGNVTSQLFANIYLNEFDQFVKHNLKIKYYFRYCDDFVILHTDRTFLDDALNKISFFLREKLLLELHPQKVEIRKLHQGIDFLGYVVLPHALVLRTSTKKRLLQKVGEAERAFEEDTITQETFSAIITSYLGVLSHSRNRKVKAQVERWSDLSSSLKM